MRALRFNPATVAVVLLVTTACSIEQPSAPSALSPDDVAGPVVINPDNLRRMHQRFPAGYEVEKLTGSASPAGLWGLTAGWAADPPECTALAAPTADAAPTQGLSGSGPGGIVYAVVTTTNFAVPAPEVLDACARWTITSRNSTATVDLAGAPSGVTMTTAMRTVVEGGRSTDSAARTATAYLGDHVVFVTVVTDPGSPEPQLPPDFAAQFLAQTVAALRR